MQFFLYLIIFTFGLLIGNFATSIFYRLPRNIVIYGFNKKHTRPPHCSFCRHELKWYEYLPLISIFSTFLKCNYCKHPIPYSYIIIEHLSALLAVGCFYFFGSNFDIFIIIFCLSISCLLTIFVFIVHKKIYDIFTISIIIEGILYRTLVDQTLFYWAISLGLGSMFSIWLLKDKEFLNIKRRYVIHLILSSSVWVFTLTDNFIP
jgi:prepilin signal peptidase PulO-like enzyme (type II secretory pathway)